MPRRLPLLVATAVATAVIAFPLGVLASHQFSDVPDGNAFHADIEALAESGVTTGCGGGKYCPAAFVTREQMAAFMNRLGALSPDKVPVVNAAKVDGKDHVLGAGPIEIVQTAGWLPESSLTAAIEFSPGLTTVTFTGAGTGNVLLPLQSPGTIDGQVYGIASVEICARDTAEATITAISAYQTDGSGAAFAIHDDTDRPMTSETCYTVSDPTPDAPLGGSGLRLGLSVSAEASVALKDVSTVWVPVDAPD